MAKVPANSFLLIRRAYTVAAENVGSKEAAVVASGIRTAVENVSKEAAPVAEEGKKDVYWMRDPKTGNWMPETHFDEVDAAQLREKLLPNPNPNPNLCEKAQL